MEPAPSKPTSLMYTPAALVLGLSITAAMPAQAHLHGLYATRAEAERRAAELKCRGTYSLGNRWMPCANERALHEALERCE